MRKYCSGILFDKVLKRLKVGETGKGLLAICCASFVICAINYLKTLPVNVPGLISYTIPYNYGGPIVQGWPPDKSRNMKLYIRPAANSFLLMPWLNLSSTELVIMVHSGDAMYNRRMAIRETWKKRTLLYPGVAVVFHVGKTREMQIQREIVQESFQFGDILQSDIEDSYTTLTIKEVLSHKFVVSVDWERAPSYIAKVDDDSYVNIPRLWQVFIKARMFSRMNLLVGHRHNTSAPDRISPEDEHLDLTRRCVCPEYMFDGDMYPPYLGGGGYVMSYDAFQCIYNQALELPFFHINDVFISGFCAVGCGLERIHYKEGFSPYHKHVENITEKDIVIHYMDAEDQREVWDKVFQSKY